MAAWLPDLIARWYDAFAPTFRDPKVGEWRRVFHSQAQWVPELLRRRPNDRAAELEAWVENDVWHSREERRYRALQGVNRAMRDAWNAAAYEADDAQWREIRLHWRDGGNLLREVPGLLLPRRRIDHPWATSHPWYRNSARDHFDFLRWRGSEMEGLQIESRVLADLTGPVELRERLNIGVVPLIESVTDFDWKPIDRASGDDRFRVSLRAPRKAAQAAADAIRRAAEEECDVVILPELCLAPGDQKLLGDVIGDAAAASGGFPWLVVAGTSHAPAGNGEFHNRAIVFDARGREVFHYNKLHPYEISKAEQDRYGLPDALNSVARVEDITPLPLRMSIADTPAGRVAVIICEDLSNIDFYLCIVNSLAIDWLLVPVLDGVQTASRWTARKAAVYAEYGISVVVVTSLSLVRAHQEFERAQNRAIPGPGVAIISRLGGDVHVVETDGPHDRPVVKSLISTRE